jgi:hypothetical protein
MNPTLKVEISGGGGSYGDGTYGDGPYGGETWVEITPYVRSWSITRGMSRELDQIQAGTGSLKLDNLTRAFEPFNTGSPFYPYIRPMVPIKISATYSSIAYGVMYGYVESWDQLFPELGFDAVADVQIVDGFKVLSLGGVDGSFIQQFTGARVSAVLSAIGYGGPSVVDTGSTTVAAEVLDTSALEHIQAVSATEMGLAFMDRDGNFRFMGRNELFTMPGPVADTTWGDGAGEHKYQDIQAPYDDSQIWNEVKVTRVGSSTPLEALNAASALPPPGGYGLRTLSRSSKALTDADAQSQAYYLVNRFSDAELRIPVIEPIAMKEPAQWPALLSLDFGQRVRVKKRPKAGGLISLDCYVIGISHEWTPDEWRVRLNLAAVGATTGFWVWDTSTWDNARWAP